MHGVECPWRSLHQPYEVTGSMSAVYSENTSIQRPLGHVPIVALPCISTSIKRPPLYSKTTCSCPNCGFTTSIKRPLLLVVFCKDHFFWPKCGHLHYIPLEGSYLDQESMNKGVWYCACLILQAPQGYY